MDFAVLFITALVEVVLYFRHKRDQDFMEQQQSRARRAARRKLAY